MNTDKNLGIAVSHRTWLHEKCLELLNDENNYIKLHPLTAIGQLDIKCIYMEEIAHLAKDNLTNGKQLNIFFRQFIEETRTKKVVLNFYGIPKIHKEPIKQYLATLPYKIPPQNTYPKDLNRLLSQRLPLFMEPKIWR
jgi:hypothetical protein